MSEINLIKEKNLPVTKTILKKDLVNIGIKPGDTIIVHSSLKSIGWVCSKEIAVIEALIEVLTQEGTLVMPAHSSDLTDPAFWVNPPIPEHWIDIVKEEMIPFDKNITPTCHMGIIPETFRKFPNVLRSNHPNGSFVSWGKNAKIITDNHSLDYPFGDYSPLARIYDLNGKILLLGVDYNTCTSIHLGEYRSECRKKIICSAPIIEDGKKIWKNYHDIDYDSDDFNNLGFEFEKKFKVIKGKIGYSDSKVINQRELVDFSVTYFTK